MSSTAFARPPQVNGARAVASEASREAVFLGKLLQIRDEVLASKHPRIHLPPKIIEQVAPRSTQHLAPPVNSRPSVSAAANGSHFTPTIASRPESSHRQYTAASGYSSPSSAQRPVSAKPPSSAIDPSLLTKSDTLIRAELQLKRQQIERSLRDQFDRKGRNNEALPEEREPRFDVEDVLAKAQALVKPESGLVSTANNSDGGESFDENSYYSSQANSWSPDEGHGNGHGVGSAEALTPQEQGATVDPTLTSKALVSKPSQVTVIDIDEEPYEPADDIEIYEPEPALFPEEHDESDYSPPPAALGSGELSQGRQRGRANGGRNNGKGPSRRQSPAGEAPSIQNPRKRRRDEKREERRRNQQQQQQQQQQVQQQQTNKRVARSPEPYIKEEPQSPPLFASYPDVQPTKRRALQPLPNDVEIISAADGRSQSLYYPEQDQSPRAYRPYDEPNSPTVIRVPQRRGERDAHDLRRIASLQHARRPYSPGAMEPQPIADFRPSRAASHAFAERPVEQIYRESSTRPSAVPRYVRERSRSPVHEYSSRGQSPMIMVPPPRRIVMDQYGNKYYAAPVDVRESAAPSARRLEVEPYYERAVTREPTMRAPPRPELYEGDDGFRMPPPPRRYVEAIDTEMTDPRANRHGELSHHPLNLEYSMRDGLERRPTGQYEELATPREYMPSRAYSVRPEVVRREMPGDLGPVRHESVQPRYVSVAAPRYREVSMMPQDALDDRRYAYAAPPQSRRFMDEPGNERLYDGTQEALGSEPRRVSYRY